MQKSDKHMVDTLTFVLSNNEAKLLSVFNPPIFLEGDYELCMVNFQAYNSIPNVTPANNVLWYNFAPQTDTAKWQKIEIPEGTYDLDDLQTYIQTKLRTLEGERVEFLLRGNNNSMTVSLTSNVDIDFGTPNSIGPLLGFGDIVATRGVQTVSERLVDINKVNAIDIVCNIVDGSYVNGEPSHILYHFYPNVAPGYKIIEVPEQKIYMPVNTNVISRIIIELVDEKGTPVNFRGEEVTVYLRLRRRGTN